MLGDVGIPMRKIFRGFEHLDRHGQLAQENPSIVEGPYVLGVQSLVNPMNIRLIAKTKNMEQWAVEVVRQR